MEKLNTNENDSSGTFRIKKFALWYLILKPKTRERVGLRGT